MYHQVWHFSTTYLEIISSNTGDVAGKETVQVYSQSPYTAYDKENGVDGIMAGGVTTFDAMLWYITDQLPNYENDPVVVSAMREACHHNFYALANSSGMNGVGKDTIVHEKGLIVINTMNTLSIVSAIILVVTLVLWILGGIKFRKTEEYKAFKEAKKNRRKKVEA